MRKFIMITSIPKTFNTQNTHIITIAIYLAWLSWPYGLSHPP
jgi:hypothetical protein